MRLVYYHAREGNFGDDLNGWLWERLAPGQWSDEHDVLFTGIGTIIGNPMPAAKRVVIFSSGFGYSPRPADWPGERWDVVAVRGPLSARVLGLPAEKAVADGALLLRALPDFAPVPEADREGVIFIPHHGALRSPCWQAVSDRAGVELVDPRSDSHQVIARIARAKLVIADSMHAAIIADAFRVPWVPVATSNAINTFKWMDWALSLNLTYAPMRISSPTMDLAFESLVQHRYGEGNFVTPPTAEAAVAHIRAAIATAEAKGEPLVPWGKKQAWLSYPGKARKLPGVASIETMMDKRLMARTADQLRQAATHSGFLSDDAILEAKTAELLDRFHRTVSA